MRLLQSSTPHPFWQGARATLPLLVGMVVFGLAYGLLAHTVGLSLAETVGMSALVLAGASQFVALGMIGAGTPAGLIVLSALFINLRHLLMGCLLYTSDAADERSSVDLGGRRIIKKKQTKGSAV